MAKTRDAAKHIKPEYLHAKIGFCLRSVTPIVIIPQRCFNTHFETHTHTFPIHCVIVPVQRNVWLMGPVSLFLLLPPSYLPLQLKLWKKKVSSLHCKSLPFATETDHEHSSSKLTNKKMGYELRASSFWFYILTWMLDWWYLHSCEELRSYWFVCAGGETGIAVPRTVFQFWG